MMLSLPEFGAAAPAVKRLHYAPVGAATGRLLAGAILVSGLLLGCTTFSPPGSTERASAPRVTKAIAPVMPEPVEQPIAVLVEPTEFVLLDENNVFFDSGATTVDARDKLKLRAYAERLKNDPQSFLTLIGHTDDLGSRSYNLALAEQRILAVSTLLRSYGVPIRQIRRYRGDGERVPNSCKSAECRQKMRRVELAYSVK